MKIKIGKAEDLFACSMQLTSSRLVWYWPELWCGANGGDDKPKRQIEI